MGPYYVGNHKKWRIHLHDSRIFLIFATTIIKYYSMMKKYLFSLILGLVAVSASAYELNRVSVHDPSVVWDPASKTYYIFGSHRAVAKSADMMSWSYVNKGKETGNVNPIGVAWASSSSDNVVSSGAFTTPAVTKVKKGGAEVDLPAFDAMAWAKRGDKSYNIAGNLWAPDVIWNPVMKKWCMYMSVNGNAWYSSIVLLTADNIEGPYTYQAPIVVSGFHTGDAYKSTDLELVLGAQSALPDRYQMKTSGSGNWGERWPNNIDPCVFYDEEGKLWMSYGSWSGGIWMLELDENTGLRDYDVTYELTGSGNGITVDPYFGKKIAGGYYVSGEASYIEYIGGYYFLFMSYGGLAAGGVAGDYNNGGYQMRVFRSEKPDGPYVDVRNTNAVFPSYLLNFGADANDNRGVNIFGAYTDWGNQAKGNYGERSQGHNSIIAAEDGRTYLVYHTRFQNRSEEHQVRVHQVFQNKDGWLVAAPFEYTGETVKSADIAASQQVPASLIPGTYKLLIHNFKLDHRKKEASKPVEIELLADGTITGSEKGTWTVTDGTSYISIKLSSSNYAYEGVVVEQTLEPKTDKAITFSGVNRNGVTIWGYQTAASTGIHSIEATEVNGDGALYDLQGRRVTTPQRKGIYIRNGKKFVMK
jgi:arabinan endo-1,5-alpha-L-arabinosidase